MFPANITIRSSFEIRLYEEKNNNFFFNNIPSSLKRFLGNLAYYSRYNVHELLLLLLRRDELNGIENDFKKTRIIHSIRVYPFIINYSITYSSINRSNTFGCLNSTFRL